MALSRQDLPVLDAEKYKVFEGCAKGAYVLEAYGKDMCAGRHGLRGEGGAEGRRRAEGRGDLATVVSMPSFKIFEEQSEEYKMSIFPHGVPKISVEAGATMGWWKYVGRDGAAIGIDRFGASAPGADCSGEAGDLRCECCGTREEAGEEVLSSMPGVHYSLLTTPYSFEETEMTQDEAKALVGKRAAEMVEDGMAVGLGTGTTSVMFIKALGERVRQGLKIRCVASSDASAALGRSLGMDVVSAGGAAGAGCVHRRRR
jgi:hypothetical protein